MDGIQMCAVAMEDAQRRLERSTAELANAETAGFAHHVRGSSAANVADPMCPTKNPFDLVVTGAGGLTVGLRRADGRLPVQHTTLRAATFHRNLEGYVVDAQGRALLGTAGPIRVPGDIAFRGDGAVVSNGTVVAHVALAHGAQLHSGFTLGSNVNAIGEMVEILDAQRSFETAEKTLTAVDAARQKATSDVGHLQ